MRKVDGGVRKVLVEELEPEMDELFQKLVPDLMDWQAATPHEVDRIERLIRTITDNDVPKFYRWFLLRMGRSMGGFAYHEMDYSAPTLLSWYDQEFEDNGSRFFKIGHTSEPELQLHMYYDFDHPARNDACVTMRRDDGGEDYKQFETFREMLATKAVQIYASRFPAFCSGAMVSDDDILPRLDAMTDRLGLKRLKIPVGPRCGLYSGGQVTMVTTCSMDLDPDSCGFALGGSDREVLRKVLGTIAMETSFFLDVQDDPRRLSES